jgi:hypothetical protein
MAEEKPKLFNDPSTPENSVKKESAIELLQSGPFSLREVALEQFDEFFDSIVEQNSLTEEKQTQFDSAVGKLLQESIEKRDRLGAFLARIKAEAKAIGDEEDRLAKRRRQFEAIHNGLRESVRMQLENWGVKKVEGQKFTFALHKSPSAVEITDELQIPAEFIDYKPTVRKNDVARAIAEGKEVPGARVLPDRTHLVIR